MAKTRGAHSFRLRVHQGPTPPSAGPSLATTGSSAVGPAATSPAAIGPSASSVVVGPSAAASGVGPSVPPVRPPAAGDAEGSSSVALISVQKVQF